MPSPKKLLSRGQSSRSRSPKRGSPRKKSRSPKRGSPRKKSRSPKRRGSPKKSRSPKRGSPRKSRSSLGGGGYYEYYYYDYPPSKLPLDSIWIDMQAGITVKFTDVYYNNYETSDDAEITKKAQEWYSRLRCANPDLAVVIAAIISVREMILGDIDMARDVIKHGMKEHKDNFSGGGVFSMCSSRGGDSKNAYGMKIPENLYHGIFNTKLFLDPSNKDHQRWYENLLSTDYDLAVIVTHLVLLMNSYRDVANQIRESFTRRTIELKKIRNRIQKEKEEKERERKVQMKGGGFADWFPFASAKKPRIGALVLESLDAEAPASDNVKEWFEALIKKDKSKASAYVAIRIIENYIDEYVSYLQKAEPLRLANAKQMKALKIE
jgi:hypothetical protein